MRDPTTAAADLLELSALELARLIGARAVSPVEVVQAVQRRLDATDEDARCLVLRTDETALAEARSAEPEIGEGAHPGPLPRIPPAVEGDTTVAANAQT